ncbi:MAG: hypothetical protein GXO69_03620 [Acidobacteria bacterium]|nr:hypothetical protein [Acidobacteriota bacterium]
MAAVIRNTLLIFIALTFVACPKVTDTEVNGFPTKEFQAAERQIAALEQAHPHRKGKAEEVHILIYDREDGDLVQMQLSLRMVAWGIHFIKEDEDSEDLHDPLNPLNHMTLRQLRKLGPGLLVKVDDEEDGSHVLIWLS